MKVIVSLLSIVLLWLLGLAGEQLLNLVHASQPFQGDAPLPAVTAFVIHHCPLNAGNFVISLTPLMLVMLGAAFLSVAQNWSPERFLYVFITIWLIAGIYISLFAAAVLLPFHVLLVKMGDSPLRAIVLSVDAVLVACFVFLCVRSLRRRREAEPDAAGNAGQ